MRLPRESRTTITSLPGMEAAEVVARQMEEAAAGASDSTVIVALNTTLDALNRCVRVAGRWGEGGTKECWECRGTREPGGRVRVCSARVWARKDTGL